MQKGSQTEQVDVEMRDWLEDMISDLGQEFF